MIIRGLEDCEEFTAGDNTILRELLHPDKMDADFRYSLAHAVVSPGKNSLRHKLKTSEVYFILEGQGNMHIGKEMKAVVPGQAVCIPPGEEQYIENTGTCDLKFLCIVDPAWRIEDEEIL